MKILVVSDKFKGSMTSRQAGEVIARGIRMAARQKAVPVEIEVVPVADGGEGMLEVVETQLPVRRFQVESLDPLERPMMADLLMTVDGSCAYIEMAATNGLWLLDREERNPRRTTTWGLGELVKFAVRDLQVPRIVIGLGGSATNDGGVGLLSSLGYCFDAKGFLADDVAAYLASVRRIDDQGVGQVVPNLDHVRIDVATDVDNPLTGPQGATCVFGRQKGAGAEDLAALEEGMKNWAAQAAAFLGKDHASLAGAGAAGGTGFALMAFLGGRQCRGWELVAELAHLEEKIKAADWVITGEGSFDRQSLQGKLPYGIASLCERYDKPLSLFCGRNTVSREVYRSLGIQEVFSLRDLERRSDICIRYAEHLLEYRAFVEASRRFQNR